MEVFPRQTNHISNSSLLWKCSEWCRCFYCSSELFLLWYSFAVTCVVLTIIWVDPEREASRLNGDIKVNIRANVQNLVTEVATVSTETNQGNVMLSQGKFRLLIYRILYANVVSCNVVVSIKNWSVIVYVFLCIPNGTLLCFLKQFRGYLLQVCVYRLWCSCLYPLILFYIAPVVNMAVCSSGSDMYHVGYVRCSHVVTIYVNENCCFFVFHPPPFSFISFNTIHSSTDGR